MLNQIKADAYRQIHSRGSYFTLAAAILLGGMITLNGSFYGIMVSSTTMRRLGAANWSALTGLRSATLSATILLYLAIALFVLVMGQEFSKKVYKNTLVLGISRLAFMTSKLMTLLIDVIVLTASYYGVVILVGELTGWSAGAPLLTLIQTLGMMLLTILLFIDAILSMGVIILMLTDSIVTAALFITLWPVLMATCSDMLGWRWLTYIDFTDVVQKIALGTLKITSLVPYLVVCLVIIIVAGGASAMMLQRKEL
ncbi:ABC transporter permease [Levilactobacillus wangkuiensis]|uniref:ABC transporter permease n=1 Tax=Levilactobacillus wangkuiensis TaxID=2799566 RepID=UPI00194E4673|nr:ABC transporter permease [Levilactobacillus wangkuiensis]